MKHWGCLFFLLIGFAAPCPAQDLSGVWQGAADNMPKRDISLVGMAIDKPNGFPLSGCLYQEFEYGKYFVIYRLKGTPGPKSLVVKFDSVLQERHPDIPQWRWFAEPISFTYNEQAERLVGKNFSREPGRSLAYTFTLYRVKLKSSPTVPAGEPTTLRVSGRDVRWYTDPALKQRVAEGNTFSTRLNKTTTFYIMQGFYQSRKSTATAVTIRVTPSLKAPKPAPKPTPASAPLVAAAAAAPVVLPTVLFYSGTATLLPTASPALARLAAELQARASLRLRIAGHTDRVGEPTKNQLLSEQRAAAVKSFLVKAGIAPGRLVAIGYGDTKELYPTPDVRNRRVEVTQIP